MSEAKKKVLMICLGNICRSPIAEAVFQDTVEKKGLQEKWKVDSAALIGYHTGKSPDRRVPPILKKHGITNYSHKARTVKAKDFDDFDFIFGMDESNIEELEGMKPAGCKAEIGLLGQYDPQKQLIIRDPYYDSGDAGFETVYQQCVRCVNAFLEANH